MSRAGMILMSKVGKVQIQDQEGNNILSIYEGPWQPSSISSTLSITSNKVTLSVGKIMDVSQGMLRLSKSQKQSIIESIDTDLDLGSHDIKANTLISKHISTSSTYGNGILYSDIDGTILEKKQQKIINFIAFNFFDIKNKFLTYEK